ncbi:MAG: DUF1428 domain-containing protein [Gammaproteobacteria bacterium]
MAHYIDGFILPVSRNHIDEYKSLVEAVAAIWLEHGALAYREYIGDDLNLDGTRSFKDLTAATSDEVVVFGWVEFESRAARDVVNGKVATDSRVTRLVEASSSGFDAARMAYGGFRSMVQHSGSTAS